MSRSRHGHKHVGRKKCGVCSGTIGAARRKRERIAAEQDSVVFPRYGLRVDVLEDLDSADVSDHYENIKFPERL